MSGLTYNGFVKKTAAEIKAEIEGKLKTAFGDQISLIPQSVFGIFVGIMAEERALHWEELENIYQAMYPSTAQGDSLSNVVLFAGISRNLNETDAELRARYYASITARGQNNNDSLSSQLLQLNTVIDAVVIDNKTDTTDANGIPPHQFLTVVKGGTDAEIAQTIWDNTPQGISSYGSISSTVIDQQGNSQIIYYSNPTDVQIYVTLNITVDANYPIDGDNQIKLNLETFGNETFLINDDVIFSKLYNPINQVAGVLDINMYIGTSPSPAGQTNIPISITEISKFDINNITVTQI